MAFQTGSATDLDDLINQLDTFAAANGWTVDEKNLVTGIFALSKNTVFVSFRWDAAGTINNLSMHQALAWSSSTEPGDHTDDSGNGYNSTTAHTDSLLEGERCVHDLGDGPFPSYYFFEKDASPAYLYIVVETSTDVFRHFGMGEIDKFADWDTASGGEFAYGQFKSSNTAISTSDTALLDGLFGDTSSNNERRAATIHMEDWPGQGASEKWGQIWGNRAVADPDDSAGEDKPKVQGGFRSGPIARHFGWLAAGSTSGLITMPSRIPPSVLQRFAKSESESRSSFSLSRLVSICSYGTNSSPNFSTTSAALDTFNHVSPTLTSKATNRMLSPYRCCIFCILPPHASP